MFNNNFYVFVDSISENKKDVIVAGLASEKQYDAYRINKALSQYRDCVLYADEMNAMPWLSARMQYDYLLFSIKPTKRRRAKWPKQIEDEELKALEFWFSVPYRRAVEIRKVLSHEQVQQILRKVKHVNE